jgi:photosystem II stability/assembly factor-like uncharacterized protein
MYLQNHWGLYRSDDSGESWKDVANGVPSDFGFAMAIHPGDPDTAWIVPLESDGFRCTPEGKLRVYKTSDGGTAWKPMSKGLPQKRALETVLRDALTVDALDPVGVYFGTRSGKLYGSSNEGKSWELILDGLPPIVAVKTAVVTLRGTKGKASSRATAKPRKATATKGATTATKRATKAKTEATPRATVKKRATKAKATKRIAGSGRKAPSKPRRGASKTKAR